MNPNFIGISEIKQKIINIMELNKSDPEIGIPMVSFEFKSPLFEFYREAVSELEKEGKIKYKCTLYDKHKLYELEEK